MLFLVVIIFVSQDVFAEEVFTIESITQTDERIYLSLSVNDPFTLDRETYVISSATILTFSFLGSAIIMRATTIKFQDLMKYSKRIYSSLFLISALHLSAIVVIMFVPSYEIIYAGVIISTIILFYFVMSGFFILLKKQKHADDESLSESHSAEGIIQQQTELVRSEKDVMKEIILSALQDIEEIKEHVNEL